LAGFPRVGGLDRIFGSSWLKGASGCGVVESLGVLRLRCAPLRMTGPEGARRRLTVYFPPIRFAYGWGTPACRLAQIQRSFAALRMTLQGNGIDRTA
jgi:hypothetical protein